jgi:hypothetical protein
VGCESRLDRDRSCLGPRRTDTRANAIDLKGASDHVGLRFEGNRKIVGFFNARDLAPFLVERVDNDIRWRLYGKMRRTLVLTLFL